MRKLQLQTLISTLIVKSERDMNYDKFREEREALLLRICPTFTTFCECSHCDSNLAGLHLSMVWKSQESGSCWIEDNLSALIIDKQNSIGDHLQNSIETFPKTLILSGVDAIR